MREKVTEEDIEVGILQECFFADFDTGLLTWKDRPQSHFNSLHAFHVYESKYVGRLAGSPDANGHMRVRISICGKSGTFFVHRVLWAMKHGAWPECQIDHKNTIKSDNKLSNLRSADNSQNMANRGAQTNSTTGVPGVHYLSRTGRYQAHIKKNGKRVHLGYYRTIEEATKVRREAEKKYFCEFAHGHSTPT